MRTLSAHEYLLANNKDSFILTTDTNEFATPEDYLNFARKADVLILPSPLTRDGIYVRGTPGVDVSAIFAVLKDHALVFAGALPLPYRQRSVSYINYSEDEEYVLEMAYITAEGTLGHLLSEYGGIVRGSRIVITGWGRIAKYMYSMLCPFTENLSVILRKPELIDILNQNGISAFSFGGLCDVCQDADIVINTVPELVIDGRVLKCMRHDVYLIDLASRPGGIDMHMAHEYGLEAVHLLALPGKCAPKSAGYALGKCIIDNFTKNGKKI